jgi:hypothetical protein
VERTRSRVARQINRQDDSDSESDREHREDKTHWLAK